MESCDHVHEEEPDVEMEQTEAEEAAEEGSAAPTTQGKQPELEEDVDEDDNEEEHNCEVKRVCARGGGVGVGRIGLFRGAALAGPSMHSCISHEEVFGQL
jgi:hypothetical protein